MDQRPPTYPRARLQQATELLHAVLSGPAPADRAMDAYFRAHRMMGSRDRAFAAETVYACLRQRRVLEFIVDRAQGRAAGSAHDLRESCAHMVAACALIQGNWAVDDLVRAGYEGDANALLNATRGLNACPVPLPVRANLPDWLAEALVAAYGEAEALALAEALNAPATLDVRCNPLKATREQLQARLREEGIEMQPTPLSPLGLRRDDRAALFGCASFREGWFEVQDEGSQLIGSLLDPRPHERVADFCAGAGGKTLHLGALMQNTGTVYAMDVFERRLQELRPRLRRSGLQNVRVMLLQHERDRALKRMAGQLDRVLVDAPCSGTGTLRRNPDLKWRAIDLGKLHALQLRILTAAARLVRPTGRLVYATCSLLRLENQDVVDEFLTHHPTFAREDAGAALHASLSQISGDVTSGGDLSLAPHRHGTDAFFAAVLRRGERPERAAD